jgi:protein phosphatase
MRFSAGNAQHIGDREQQQDSFGFSDPSDKAFVRHGGFLGVVADGMGGLSNGQEASSAAVRSFLAAYQTKPATESVADALSRSLTEANRAVSRIVESSSASGAGTTLVAAVVLDRELYWIAAGDSRIYWLHENQLTQLTADHIYAANLNRDVALGRISRKEAENHPERASLTSYLGQPEPALTDRNVKPLFLNSGDCVLLCSDGFYRALSPEEIVDGFRGNPQHACDSLVEHVLSKGRKQQDNVTVIALKSRNAEKRFARLSRKAVLLAGATCMILLSFAAGFWAGRHSFIQNSSPAAVAPKPPAPPVTVSQPNALTAITPSVTSPPAAKPHVKPGAHKPAPPNDDRHNQVTKHPSPTGADQPDRGSGSEASGVPASTDHSPSGQTSAPAPPASAPSEQTRPDTDTAPKPPTPESSPGTKAAPSPDAPAPQPTSQHQPEFTRQTAARMERMPFQHSPEYLSR